MKKHIGILLFGFYLLQGCTDLTLCMPTSRMMSPESNGKLWRIGLGAGVISNDNVTIVPDAAARPAVIAPPSIARSAEDLYFVNMGLSSFIDLELRTAFANTELYAKFQLLGQAQHEAEAGNFSITPTIGFGTGSVTNSGTQDILFGPGNAAWNGSASYTSVDLAVIFGYRVSDYVLLYGGPFATKYKAQASVHQDAVTSPASPAADYSLSESGTKTGVNLASQFTFSKEKKWSITAELVYSNLKWNDEVSSNGLTGALDFGYLF